MAKTKVGTDQIPALTSSSISEGANLYFTNERVDDRVAALVTNGTGLGWTYDDTANTLTGNVSLAVFSTTNLSEGTNLYFTNARVDSRIDATFADGEVPTGAVNGINTVFTLAHAPRANSLHLYLAGLRVSPALYGVSTDTITFGVAPVTGLLLADYRY